MCRVDPARHVRWHPPAKRVRRWRAALGFALGLCGASAIAADDAARELTGLPFTRHYSFDQIGDVTRSGQLTFDQAGRLVAVQERAYVVLNDDAWFDLGGREPDAIKVMQVARDSDGTTYFGALGAWGILAPGDDGRMHAQAFAPATPPAWVRATGFNQVLCRPEGIYFAGWNGMVFWNRTTREHRFYEVPEVARIFALGDKLYVSSHVRRVLALVDGALVPDPAFGQQVMIHAVSLPEGRGLLATSGRRLVLYDCATTRELPPPLAQPFNGPINALLTLPEGGVAVAVSGGGLYLLSPVGEIVRAFTASEFRGISRLAVNEAGVLWALAETGVIKILYGAPVTLFDQTLGIAVNWPQIATWNNRVVIASNGRLYETVEVDPGEPTRFRQMAGQPPAGTWGIAARGEWLLSGNAGAIFARRPDEPFRRVLSGGDMGRLVMLDSGACIAIGATEIAAMACVDGEWVECAPRVPGIGFPSRAHAARNSAWVEMGANRVGRVTLQDGRLKTQVFDTFPWPPRWVHVSVIENTVMLAGAEAGRLFFDEDTGRFCEPAALQETLARAPHWIARFRPDAQGIWWASHERGMFTLDAKSGGRDVDATTFRILHEHLPGVHHTARHGTWIATGDSLYHVNARAATPAPAFRPRVVAVRDLRTQREHRAAPAGPAFPAELGYHQNSIAFRFFSGSYFSRRPPDYEYRINQSAWSSLEATSLLRLPDLREGRYAVDVRLVDERGPLGATTSFAFTIAPPWYRAWYAFAGYALFGAGSILGVIRLSLQRARTRNAALEKIVAERTAELAATMQKLEQETRTAATLAERNRLAGEIHDSLEQGFSGLMLQLETTAALDRCPSPVQNALSVARNMVAFSRNEVRHAVWDLHSPLLASGGLEAALKNLIAQLAPGPTRPAVIVEGEARALGSAVEHHLLRIAQEAIANAVKHAAATQLEVRLIYAAAEVRLSVADDGRGFDSGAVLADGRAHFGLRSLRGRAAKIGGTVAIESQPGAGTRITVRVPLAVPNPVV